MKEGLKHFIARHYNNYIVNIGHSVFYITGFLILLTLIFQNRALFIGYIFGFFLTLNISSHSREKTRNLILALLGLIVSTIIIAHNFKTDSTEGRLLIYKISDKVLSDNFPTGLGLNNFDVAYGNAQIDYFQSGHYSKREFLLADNIKHAYNDYLELIIELGWIGVILILTFFIMVGFLIKNALKKNNDHPVILLFACIQILAISIAALFTFMFYQQHWQFVFLICLLIVFYFNRYLRLNRIIILGTILTMALAAYHYGHHIFSKSDYDKADEAFVLYKAGYFDDANEIYEEIYPNLERDNAITASYIHSLMDNQEFTEAERLLNNILLKDNSSLNYELLAHCYEKQHKIKLAEATYLNSIYKVPNRFGSRFKLFLLYLNTNQTIKAQRIGMDILKMPVKVPSKVIVYFKQTVKKELNKMAYSNTPDQYEDKM